ncbi:MAG: hypothetical protein KIT56_08820 [Gammaproteobacteria bacterium]|nr:hypothetical protein [Gammaproteobacteria bacterium]MCW5583958.1 hypothetical protein [Gammaproteobacteria bacterium]
MSDGRKYFPTLQDILTVLEKSPIDYGELNYKLVVAIGGGEENIGLPVSVTWSVGNKPSESQLSEIEYIEKINDKIRDITKFQDKSEFEKFYAAFIHPYRLYLEYLQNKAAFLNKEENPYKEYIKKLNNILTGNLNLSKNETRPVAVVSGDALKRRLSGFVVPTAKQRLKFGVSDTYNTMSNAMSNVSLKKSMKRVIKSPEEIALQKAERNLKSVLGFDGPKKKKKKAYDNVTINNQNKTRGENVDLSQGDINLSVIPTYSRALKLAKEAANKGKSGLVIYSMTDEFEHGPKIQPKDFNKVNAEMKKYMREKFPERNFIVEQKQTPFTDFGPGIHPENILKTVYDMRQDIEDGKEIIIHCKAGKARSALVLACYVNIYGDLHGIKLNNESKTVVDAAAYLKSQRPQVDLHHDEFQDVGMKEDEFKNQLNQGAFQHISTSMEESKFSRKQAKENPQAISTGHEKILALAGKLNQGQKALFLHEMLVKEIQIQIKKNKDYKPTSSEIIEMHNQFVRYGIYDLIHSELLKDINETDLDLHKIFLQRFAEYHFIGNEDKKSIVELMRELNKDTIKKKLIFGEYNIHIMENDQFILLELKNKIAGLDALRQLKIDITSDPLKLEEAKQLREFLEKVEKAGSVEELRNIVGQCNYKKLKDEFEVFSEQYQVQKGNKESQRESSPENRVEIASERHNQSFDKLKNEELEILKNATGGFSRNKIAQYANDSHLLDEREKEEIETHINKLHDLLKKIDFDKISPSITYSSYRYSKKRYRLKFNSDEEKITNDVIEQLINTYPDGFKKVVSKEGKDEHENMAKRENVWVMLDAIVRYSHDIANKKEAKPPASVENKEKLESNSTTAMTMRAFSSDLTQAVSVLTAPKHKPAVSEEQKKQIGLGRIYVKLMLDACRISGLTLDQIQFNFCLEKLSKKSERIKTYIEEYLNNADQEELEKLGIEKSVIEGVIKSMPSDASKLHDYRETLLLRAKSFKKAANMIIANSDEIQSKDGIKKKVKELFDKFEKKIKNLTIDNKIQAYYDAFLEKLKEILKGSLNITDDKIISEYLRNAETIVNIKQKKSHVTISGILENSSLQNSTIRLQIDTPCNQFQHLSEEQKTEWKNAILAYMQKKEIKKREDKTGYPWFDRLPTYEKEYWANIMYENGDIPEDAPIGPVVKKEGMPGLRNLSLSSFATIQYDENEQPKKMSASLPSVRSSNLVVQNKEKTHELSEDEKKLTKMNLDQVNHLYDKYMKEKFSEIWSDKKNRQKYVLYQTLLRKKGGGDDYVIDHKDKAVNELRQGNHAQGVSIIMYTSNHCIGTPQKLSTPVHLFMHAIGANTKGMNHVVPPVKDFVKQVVISTLQENGVKHPAVSKNIWDLYELAAKGKLTEESIKQKMSDSHNLILYQENKNPYNDTNPEAGRIRTQQMDSLKRVLQALNMYHQINNKKFAYQKTYQLHMAALEEIIYQDTGNRIQSSCKSGKDREGLLKCYRNAMLAFFHGHGYLPPAKENDKKDREKFIEIFLELFKTHHQARLAEENAVGCEGQKALLNILPKDILDKLREDPDWQNLLQQHKNNSTLNDFGKSKVKADPEAYQEAIDNYSPKAGQSTARPSV